LSIVFWVGLTTLMLAKFSSVVSMADTKNYTHGHVVTKVMALTRRWDKGSIHVEYLCLGYCSVVKTS
jgi:hypothetical protein